MTDGEDGPLPPRDEQRQALVALWVVGTVGAGAFVVYDYSAAVDLPLVLVPVMYLALVGATLAMRSPGD